MLTAHASMPSRLAVPGFSPGGATGATSAALALVAALGGAGCDAAAKHRRDERRMIAALTEARDRVCACADLACAEDAEQQLADFLLQHVDALKKVPASAPIATESTRIDGELRACKHRLEEAGHAS